MDVRQTGRHISIWLPQQGSGLLALVSWILIVEKGMLRLGWAMAKTSWPRPPRNLGVSWPSSETAHRQGGEGGSTVAGYATLSCGVAPLPGILVSQPSNWGMLLGGSSEESDNWTLAEEPSSLLYLQEVEESIAMVWRPCGQNCSARSEELQGCKHGKGSVEEVFWGHV